MAGYNYNNTYLLDVVFNQYGDVYKRQWQDGLFRQFKELDYNNNYSYTRYNYRGNLDLDITKSTL